MTEPMSPTKPVDTDKMPPGIPFIIGNEAAERFCFYGMRTILVVFMTKYLLDRSGGVGRDETRGGQGLVPSVRLGGVFPAVPGRHPLGRVLGQSTAPILWLSIVYCLGCFGLAMDNTRLGLLLGLGLIAIGSGGIKPCVSANVGDQFGARRSASALESI